MPSFSCKVHLFAAEGWVVIYVGTKTGGSLLIERFLNLDLQRSN